MRIFINKILIITTLVIFCSNAISADHNTCADEIRNRYRKVRAALIVTSPITVPVSITVILGAVLGRAIVHANHLKRYSSLLKAATIEYKNAGNQKSTKIIDKFYKDCFLTEKAARRQIINVDKYSEGNNQVFSSKPMELTRDYVIHVLHLLNTEPVLRKECLRFKYYIQFSNISEPLAQHLRTENALKNYKKWLDKLVYEYHFPENNLVRQFSLETVKLDL